MTACRLGVNEDVRGRNMESTNLLHVHAAVHCLVGECCNLASLAHERGQQIQGVLSQDGACTRLHLPQCSPGIFSLAEQARA